LAPGVALATHAAMLPAHLASALLASLALSGCVMPPTPAQRLNEAAFELSDAARFGRMDIASEHVREIAREEFGRRHAGWGKSVRVVDVEMNRMSMRKDGDADVFVTVSWQRAAETIMRSTEIAQRWTSTRGTWTMISEEERGGDRGLLSEAEKPKGDEAPAASEPAGGKLAPRSRYQTRVIYEQ
jgi:hypothetical protein